MRGKTGRRAWTANQSWLDLSMKFSLASKSSSVTTVGRIVRAGEQLGIEAPSFTEGSGSARSIHSCQLRWPPALC